MQQDNMHSFNDRFHLYHFLSIAVKTLNSCEPQNNMGTKKQEVLEGVFTKKTLLWESYLWMECHHTPSHTLPL